MQILNGKQSTINFRLDNGELLKVKPGEISKSFVPSVFQLQAILAMGNPEEIAIILSSSYEMSVLSQLNGSMAYLKANEQVARAAILEGKDLSSEVISSDNVEINQLKEKLVDKEKTISELTEELTKKSEELANSPIHEYKSQLDIKESEVSKLTDVVTQLNEKINKLTSEYNDKCNEVNQLIAKKEQSEIKLTELNNKLTSAVTSENEKVNDLTTKLQEAETRIKELEDATPQEVGVPQETYDETLAELESAKNEITQLKEDGAKIVENYKKAKDALVAVMEQFHIHYTGTEYVQDQV